MNKYIKIFLIVELQIILVFSVISFFKAKKTEGLVTASTIMLSDVFKDKQIESLGEIQEEDIVLGDKNAEVKIIMYTKFNCIHCIDFYTQTFPTLYKEYIEPGYVSFTVRYLFGTKHEHIDLAELAYTAYNQDKFMEYLEITTLSETETYLEKVNRVKTTLDLDIGNNKEIIKHNYVNTLKAGMRGTPTFIINGKKYTGHMKFELFEQIIDSQFSSCD